MSQGCQLAWFEQMIRALGRWLVAYADHVCDYTMYEPGSSIFHDDNEYKGKRFLCGAWYIVIARRTD